MEDTDRRPRKMNTTIIRCYSELILLPTFEERFEYLKLGGKVGKETFGFDRYINQKFYQSDEWKNLRHEIIARDLGCDLGVDGEYILSRIIIHHMNPITKKDILERSDFLLNPEYLITTTKRTHDAIHYGDSRFLGQALVERRPGDTCPWKRR